jgi:hypothetical protein
MYITTTSSTTADSLRPAACDPQAARGGDLYRARVPGVRGTLPFRSRINFS